MRSIWNYLEFQDASCKSSMEEKDGGMWRGMKFHIIDEYVYHLIGEVKCTNIWLIIEIWLHRVTSEETLDYK